MSIEVDAVGLRIFSEFKDAAKDVWDRWAPAVQQLVEQCAMDAGKLAIDALAGKDVTVERAHVTAQLSNLKVASGLAASNALWTVVSKVLVAAATILTK